MNKDQIIKILKPIIWDYNIDPVDFFEVAVGMKDRVGFFNQEAALIRMLERLSWYDLINLFGINKLSILLRKEIIARLRMKELREQYEFARKILQGEPVSFSGWSPEYREKIKTYPFI